MSKYDGFWKGLLPTLRELVETAAGGSPAELDVSPIRDLGKRQSWYGKAIVRPDQKAEADMAHAASLARTVTNHDLCDPWPDRVFVFTISSSCRLQVKADALVPPTSHPRSERLDPGEADLPDWPTTSALDAATACERIHRLLDTLPLHSSPEEVPLADGLYFFYEHGESGPHGQEGRVVRIGNHPHAERRLAGRLQDHYRTSAGAKNGSVFRRYLGGALLRRDDPSMKCLEPGRGEGHWERQNQPACAACGPYETRVTSYLRQQCRFRCVRVDDLVDRNLMEARLIATVATCSACTPSERWLGNYAYPAAVRRTGLWNSEHAEGPAINADELVRFEGYVADTPRSQKRPDRSTTLLLIPCSASKKGSADPGLPLHRVADSLTPSSAALLAGGRELAFRRTGTFLDRSSPERPALFWYTGQPYKTPGVRQALVRAISEGLHCLIISGGYGLLRPEEPIHYYEAPISKTYSVWRTRVPTLLREYVERNRIERCYGVMSQAYAAMVPANLAPETVRIVPEFDSRTDAGAAMRVVPGRVGTALRAVLDEELRS